MEPLLCREQLLSMVWVIMYRIVTMCCSEAVRILHSPSHPCIIGSNAVFVGVPEDIRIWLRERKPNSLRQAATLANDYAWTINLISGHPKSGLARPVIA